MSEKPPSSPKHRRTYSMKGRVLLIIIIAVSLATVSLKRSASIFALSRYDAYNEVEMSSIAHHYPKLEPFVNRWDRKLSSSKSRGRAGGYLFFKHIRKAGGTTLREYFSEVMKYHNNSRMFEDFVLSLDGDQVTKDLLRVFAKNEDRIELLKQHKQEWPNSSKLVTQQSAYRVHYGEQEFAASDYKCYKVDPRWKETLSVIALRHPIERHISEFFYSGEGKNWHINRTQLYVDKEYTHAFSSFLQLHLPQWLRERDGWHPQRNETRPFKWFCEFNSLRLIRSDSSLVFGSNNILLVSLSSSLQLGGITWTTFNCGRLQGARPKNAWERRTLRSKRNMLSKQVVTHCPTTKTPN